MSAPADAEAAYRPITKEPPTHKCPKCDGDAKRAQSEPNEYFRTTCYYFCAACGVGFMVERTKRGLPGNAEPLMPGRDYDDRCDMENPEC